MATTIVATAIGLCTTLSSFDDSGSGGGDDPAKRYRTVTEDVTCDDMTANIQYSQGTDGKIGIGAKLGPLGEWNANISGTGAHSGSGTLTNFKIAYPKNNDGSKMTFKKTSCPEDGNDRSCTTYSPCLQLAISEIKSAF